MELMLSVNLYIVVVAVWTASFIYRSAHKGMRLASFVAGLLLLCLAIIYLFLDRTESYSVSSRNIWYGLILLLFIECMIRLGLIHVNTKYRLLFIHSPLKMRIIDNEKQTVLSSSNTMWYGYDTFSKALGSYPDPAWQDENTLLFAEPITGGYALWQEDITILTTLHKRAEDSVQKLEKANILLIDEEKINQEARTEIEKTRLMEQLEKEITGYTIRLETMIEQLENAVDKPKATARITLLLCYTKRRCNMFFREKEQGALPAYELVIYMDELVEIAAFTGVEAIITSDVNADLDIRKATLLYDLFGSIMYWATWITGIKILTHIGIEDSGISMRLLPNEDISAFQMSKSLMASIASAGGTYEVKDLDGAVGICLSFPERVKDNHA